MAGLEDRSVSPPRFQAYVMGVVRGVPVQPNAATVGVQVPMTTLLDHSVTTLPQPPAPTPPGPDRVVSTVSVDLGQHLFAILPQGTRTTLLPASGGVSFVGLPALDGTLSNSSYELTAQAVTGSALDVPRSVVTNIETTNANDLVTLGGFFPIPRFVQPSSGAWAGTHVQLMATGPIDLIVLDVSSGQGLVNWKLVAPGGAMTFDVPDLAQIAGAAGLLRGPIRSTLSVARIDQFDYGRLRYGQLAKGAWSAYAQDTATGSF
jgi:hypothetical protein